VTNPVIIGDAQLYLGDCLEILPMLGKVDAVITDPPYGVAATSNWNGKHGDCRIAGDDSTALRDQMLVIAKPMQAIVFGSWKQPKPAGTKAVLTWDKTERSGMGDLKFPWKQNTEEVYVIGSGFVSLKRESSVLRFTPHLPCVGLTMETDHPYQKPESLMRYLIARTTGRILDPFMGSGTTGVACANLGRRFIGIEIERKYFDIACERIDNAYRQKRLFA
jgi:DNA modification methylase